MLPQLQNGGIARAHDLANLVAQNQVVVDDLVLTVALLCGAVRIQHLPEWAVNIERHDRYFEQKHRENVDGRQDDHQVGGRSLAQVRIEHQIYRTGQYQEE